jgi:S-formylglutathione hydrolase FrmB
MGRVVVGWTAIAVVALSAAAVARSHSTSVGSPQEVHRALYSPAVQGRLGLSVYLPEGYSSSSQRYPVVYFLHGLPATSSSYGGADFLARALAATDRRAIIVAPQGARDNDSDPEYLDWGPGRNWETAITRDVIHYVDAHWRTVPTRTGRAIVGLSAGGYGAVLLALHHLEAFSVVESWSGYFRPTNPAGTRTLDLGSSRANAKASAHAFVTSLRRAFAQRPTFFAFYVGHDDERFEAENVRFDRELTAAKVPHLFHVYPGGHSQNVWSAHARGWLTVAADHLARPTR